MERKYLTEWKQFLTESAEDDVHMIAEELDPKTWLEKLATDLNTVWETRTGNKLKGQASTVIVGQPGPNELYTINLPATNPGGGQASPYATVLGRSLMTTQHGLEAQRRHAAGYGNSLITRIGNTSDERSYASKIAKKYDRTGNLQAALKGTINRWVAAYQKQIAVSATISQ